MVALTIVRSGSPLSISLPVSPNYPKVIPYLQGTYPAYFICGPLVFSVASEEMIASASNFLSRSGSPLLSRRFDQPAFDGEELVLVPAPFFSHSLSRNYTVPLLRPVKTINDIAVKNLRHLIEIIRDSKNEFIVIEFAGRAAETLVFPRKELVASTEEVLTDNGIRNQGSPDMMVVWNQGPHK
jgi:hypothetical protein